jgi:hypothetical protein
MFHVFFLDKVARPAGKSLAEVAVTYDELCGRPSLAIREELQRACRNVLDKATTFQDFFVGINFPVPSNDKILEALRLAVYHSRFVVAKSF